MGIIEDLVEVELDHLRRKQEAIEKVKQIRIAKRIAAQRLRG